MLSKNDQVKVVLRSFKDMGATKEQLVVERGRLEKDPRYLADWVSTVVPPRKNLWWRELKNLLLLKV